MAVLLSCYDLIDAVEERECHHGSVEFDDFVLGQTKGVQYKGNEIEGICGRSCLCLELRVRCDEQLTPGKIGIQSIEKGRGRDEELAYEGSLSFGSTDTTAQTATSPHLIEELSIVQRAMQGP